MNANSISSSYRLDLVIMMLVQSCIAHSLITNEIRRSGKLMDLTTRFYGGLQYGEFQVCNQGS